MGSLLYAALLASGVWLFLDRIDPAEKADYLSDLVSNDALWIVCFGLSAVISAAIYGAKVRSESRYIPAAIYAVVVGLLLSLRFVDVYSHAILVFSAIAPLCFWAFQVTWRRSKRGEENPAEECDASEASFQEKVDQVRAKQRKAREHLPNNSLKSGTPKTGANRG